MTKVDVLPIAQLEFCDGFRWYLERSRRAARRLALEVKATIAAIRQDPKRFARWGESDRYCRLEKFPYFVAYRQDNDNIIIVAIRHAARDHEAWNDR
jgi:plasmid stabilization system protein ParE